MIDVTSQYRGNWYRFEDVAAACGWSPRTARRELAGCPDSLQCVADNAGHGRPRLLYHFTVDPVLTAFHLAKNPPAPEGVSVPEPVPDIARPDEAERRPLSPDDLAIATFRMEAVDLYERLMRSGLRERAAADAVLDEFRARPRRRTLQVDERIRSHTRRKSVTVEVSRFSRTSLRAWGSLIRREIDATRRLTALAPTRKGHCGGWNEVDVPEDLVCFVRAVAVSTARSDITKALAYAKANWPGEFPDLSVRSWTRRILAADPRKSFKSIAHSVARFRREQLPDLEIDWNQLSYNQRWEIDDVQHDWYAHSSDLVHTLRPYAYAILRCSTRQWIGLVTAETPITRDQVKSLMAFTMVSTSGGIPDEIVFEHGAVACSQETEAVLDSIGVHVHRISMDSGKVTPASFPDASRGHPQGHALIEANHRRVHNILWAQPGQVGPEARHTGPTRTDNLRAASERRAADLLKMAQDKNADGNGRLLLPTPQEWHRIILAAVEEHNATPHSGLPRTIDPATGKERHLSPNERAATFDDPVKVLPQELLSAFWTTGERVPVGRNGVRVNGRTYGRFDADLLALRSVTIYADSKMPGSVYVVELGRCVDVYTKTAPGDEAGFADKARREKDLRNQYEAACARQTAMAPDGAEITVDRLVLTSNATPNRRVEIAHADALRQMINNLRRGQEQQAEKSAALDARFSAPITDHRSPITDNIPSAPAPILRRAAYVADTAGGRRGILSRSRDMAAELCALGSTSGQRDSLDPGDEPDPANQ